MSDKKCRHGPDRTPTRTAGPLPPRSGFQNSPAQPTDHELRQCPAWSARHARRLTGWRADIFWCPPDLALARPDCAYTTNELELKPVGVDTGLQLIFFHQIASELEIYKHDVWIRCMEISLLDTKIVISSIYSMVTLQIFVIRTKTVHMLGHTSYPRSRRREIT